MAKLTPRQARVLSFVRAFIEKRGFPPTHAEIAKGLRFRSPNAAGEHLRLLAKKGAVTLTPGASRGLRIERGGACAAEEALPAGALPLIGHVAAGQPILAQENVERSVGIDPGLFSPRAQFLLRVRGDSMVDAGILPGDLVAVSKTGSVRNGEIAVVRIEEDVTVKRWRVEGRGTEAQVILEPANPDHRPIVLDPLRTQVVIEGRVVGVLRLGAS